MPPGAHPDRETHNKDQASFFDAQVDFFQGEQPAEVVERLGRTVAAALAGMPSDARVLDVGSGTGCLIPHIREAGASDILAIDLSSSMLAALEGRFGQPGNVAGNDAVVRTWRGDVCDLPDYMGPFHVAFFNAMFGNIYDQRAALIRSALLSRPGSRIVLSHPLGRGFVDKLHAADPVRVPWSYPTREELQAMIADLPLRVASFIDDADNYAAVLEVPAGYTFEGAPLRAAGRVVHGAGRGSSKMGTPTANIDPADCGDVFAARPAGVYFGWARREEGDGAVYPMVMNVGQRPTIDDGSGVTVEVHVIGNPYGAEEFYGQRMRVLVSGFLRPEIRFGSIDELVARIKADIGLANAQLGGPVHQQHKTDAFLQ
ncbi:unnamed protein product [Pedinophyceae sp. YPF-701]|nr:unnamed protein product [Pedinophyceae sp. YPF-701]